MKNKYKVAFAIGLFLIVLINLVSAEYVGHPKNKNLEYSFTSNNATSCNLTTANTPYGVININLASTRNGQTFNFTIPSSYFANIGDYCFNIVCTDGNTNEGGSFCRNINPSGNYGAANIVFFIFVILLIYAITFIGFFSRNSTITILGGMAMIFLGIYMNMNGIIIYKDSITEYLSILTWALGATLAIWAIIEELEII